MKSIRLQVMIAESTSSSSSSSLSVARCLLTCAHFCMLCSSVWQLLDTDACSNADTYANSRMLCAPNGVTLLPHCSAVVHGLKRKCASTMTRRLADRASYTNHTHTSIKVMLHHMLGVCVKTCLSTCMRRVCAWLPLCLCVCMRI